MTQVFGRGVRPRCLDTAQAALKRGISLVPIANDGTKRPLVNWKQYQERQPDASKVGGWYRWWPEAGLAFVTGTVSRSLEALDFDDLDSYNKYLITAHTYGLEGLVNRVERGYLERTPKGVHWLYRCSGSVTGNQKLAGKIKGEDEGKTEVQTLIETRGEGGYLIVAPSGGKVHPSGDPYRLVQGGISSIVTVTSEERQILLALARSLDQLPKTPSAAEVKPQAVKNLSSTTCAGLTTEGNIKPGDDFNARANWHLVLVPKGWRWLGIGNSGEDLWRRPGKSQGVSATTNLGGLDLLHVFSTSTPFQTGSGQGKWYSKFGAYALLNHNGDWKAAAQALSRQGYGRLNLNSAGQQKGNKDA